MKDAEQHAQGTLTWPYDWEPRRYDDDDDDDDDGHSDDDDDDAEFDRTRRAWGSSRDRDQSDSWSECFRQLA